MRKMIQSIVLFILIVFCLTGCSRTCDYPFLHPVEEIAGIEIGVVYRPEENKGEVLTEDDDDAMCFESIAVLSPEQQEFFLERFSKVECVKCLNDPMYLSSGRTVAYIRYINGDYELIHSSAQGTYDYGYKLFVGYGRFYTGSNGYELDADAFNALINQTLAEIEEAE